MYARSARHGPDFQKSGPFASLALRTRAVPLRRFAAILFPAGNNRITQSRPFCRHRQDGQFLSQWRLLIRLCQNPVLDFKFSTISKFIVGDENEESP